MLRAGFWKKEVTETLTEDKVKEVIESFIGDYDQIPPMYSALKVNGKKLYELAREGKVVERKARPVKILDIQIIENESSAGPYGRCRVPKGPISGLFATISANNLDTGRMYGITDPYKSIGVSIKGCERHWKKSKH